MKETDEVIYHRFLRDGNDDDMRELMSRHRESLTLFIYGFVHDMYDAEDIMLDAFVIAGMGKSFFHGKSSFKSWLFGIGRNQALTFIKKRKRTHQPMHQDDAAASSSVQDADKAAEKHTPEMEILRRERDLELYTAMKQLSPDYQQVLYLVYFERMTNEEIAKVMKKSKKQVYNLVHRSKNALKDILIKQGFDPEIV